ncbi:MAG: histidine--tRNA ligase [Cytophagales bacterium]
MSKPSLVKGTRDFGPIVMARRNYIFSIIKSVFKKFGYQPLETPSMENLATLTGKYGDEGDQLLFKILNSGDYLKDAPSDLLQTKDSKKSLNYIAEKGLRYDLTVPFARYVVMNKNDLTFPFKRYQIQPVWRADRPQRGRYREFYQCDADVVGTQSLLCEAEIVLMIDEVLSKLGLNDFTIKLNNRKILSGIAEAIGAHGQESTICVAIDKLDKIGVDAVNTELEQKGLSAESIQKLQLFMNISGTKEETLSQLKDLLKESETGLKGVDEVGQVFEYLKSFEVKNAKIQLDTTLARGLSYYTGCIFEVKVNNAQMGSISGGGRYDNLTGVFGLPDMPGVGFSFGVDRIYDVLDELNLFNDNLESSVTVMLAAFDSEAEKYALSVLQKLRNSDISAELYPEQAKIKKQMTYADNKKIPFVVLIGSEEIQTGLLTCKDMQNGTQEKISIEDLIQKLI